MVTHYAIDTLPIAPGETRMAECRIDWVAYGQMRLRFNARVWRIYQLHDRKYGECDASLTFPVISKDDLYQFLTTCQTDEVAAETNFRTWFRTQINEP